MTVEHQKEVADKVLNKLKMLDPCCILAGGAPRDWYFGNEAKDLDIYFYHGDHLMSDSLVSLDALGFKFVEKGYRSQEQLESYDRMKNLIRVWDMEVEGVTVQLIQLDIVSGYDFNTYEPKVFKLCNNSLSRVCYHNGEIKPSNEFTWAVKNKVCLVQDERAPNINRTKEKFPDFKYVSGVEYRDAKKILF